jgi:hypothetical protein
MLILGVYRLFASIMMVVMGQFSLNNGVLLGLNAFAMIGITLWAYKKAEQWSWWFLLILGGVPITYCIIDEGFTIWTIIGLVFLIPALIIPVKAFFSK